jgi:hypothetical protein
VPVASVLGIITGIIVSWPTNQLIRAILFSNGKHMPGKELLNYTLPFDGAITASLFLLCGSCMAPSKRRLTVTILLLLGAILSWTLVGNFYSSLVYPDGPKRIWWPVIGTYSGGLITFLILYFRFREKNIQIDSNLKPIG